MKKKAIEKVPYLKLSETNGKKDVKYIGCTAVKIIGREKHLFLEIYKNDKTSMEIPMVRIVLTKKDFGSYFPYSKEWTKSKIKTDYSGDLLWKPMESPGDTWNDVAKRNILQSVEHLERIKKFCKEQVWSGDERWWEYIYRHQYRITTGKRMEASRKKYERRQQALRDRMKYTGPLPEKEILKQADNDHFHNEHYLYYKKYRSRAKIACSKCGGVAEARWRMVESDESRFQYHIEEPKEGHYGTCPVCKARGIFKCQGKVKSSHGKTIHLFLGQRYKDKGVLIRYIDVRKEWKLGIVLTEKGKEMKNAYEELSGVEIARAYFEPEKPVQIDYHKYSIYSGDFWDDCNMGGMGNICINEAPVLPETWKALEKTMFRYSGLKEYTKKEGEVNPIKYLKCYQQKPQIEVLTKMGLTRVVKKLVEGYTGVVVDEKAKCPDAFLGIRKERVKQLIKADGNIRILEAMQIEKRIDQNWTKEQIDHLAETCLSLRKVELAMKYMTMQKLLNRIEKYAGCKYGENCIQAAARIRHIATIYTDYLSMREELGYDTNNTVYQYPKNLEEAHNKMAVEQNKEKEKERIREMEDKYPEIRRGYKKLRKKYAYEDETYIIRPARSAGEIIAEGRTLHHCVGGNDYLRKHNRGETYILLLRHRREPENPYITVEIDGKYPKIIQWYGDKNRKPDQKSVQSWLDNYLKRLKGIPEMTINA